MVLYHGILACDRNHLYKIYVCYPYPRRLHMKCRFYAKRFQRKNKIENIHHKHVCSPGAGADHS